MRRYFHCILLFVCAVVFVSGANAQDDDDVVKITSKLVQVDAVVTDKKGEQITDLNVSDFQVLQDGKAQKITGFSYVPLGGSQPAQQSTTTSITTSSRRAGRGRVITFVVDDGNCRVSASGMRAAKEALQKFVRE